MKKKNFIKDMNLKDVRKYKKPQMVLLSGYPGTDKTYLAKKLSRKYKFFLLSTDYVRNYFYINKNEVKDESKIPSKVEKINRLRLLKLLLRRKSFVLDKDVNTLEELGSYIKLSKLFSYDLTIIGLESTDEKNTKRIEKRVMDYNIQDNSVIGDNVCYSSSYPSWCYYDIKDRKPRFIDDSDLDYKIKNNGSLEDFNMNIDKVLEDYDLKIKRLIK